jgi:hypothetical protein
MKKHIIYTALALPTLLVGACASDEPFSSDGEGSLRLRMVVNSEVTRSEMNTEELADKCVIYISDSKGLLHKYNGLGEVPSSIALKSGHYVGEAWTGDSVTASFDKKFYKAYQPFDITKGDVANVVLNCKIANVVASVAPAENLQGKLKNYTVTVGNSRGSLNFTEENVAYAHGYFMQPNGDTSLTWIISGENEDGKAFTKEGVINNVKSAHEYVLNLSYNPTVDGDVSGGAFITVTVNDEEILVEDNVTIYAAPVIEGDDFDVNSTLAGPNGSFSDKTIKIYAHEGFSALTFKFSDKDAFGLPTDQFNLANLTEDAETSIKAAGLSWYFIDKTDLEQRNAVITLPAAMLNKLANGEYTIDITAADTAGRTRKQTLRINVSDAAVEPETVEQSDIRAYSITLYGTLVKDDYTNPGFQYRKQGTSDWTTVLGVTTRASQKFMAQITGLQAGTTYEYRVIADGYVNPQVLTFTTESIFAIPNAGFETWVTNSKGAYIPGSSTTPTFWDSGNHGSITMSKNITTPSSDILNSGNYSALLQSQFVGIGSFIGRFAAGNIYAGSYDNTDGTDGELTFGRPFNGTHPIKLRGWANYRPGTVDYVESGANISKGDTDQGQLYVALTTKAFSIKTKTKELFDQTDAAVLAYGEIVWTGNYGDDGKMRQFEITLEPRSNYYTSTPTYIVIVASASRYGDYFSGSSSSKLYIDDLELVYE